MLAQSLVTINGLSVAQPGTSSTSSDDNRTIYFDNKKHVWLDHPWFITNIEELGTLAWFIPSTSKVLTWNYSTT